MRKLLPFLSLLIFLAGCTEKMVTIPEFVEPESDRVILIEEFTGASCSNCPQGADAIADILATYPNNTIAVGVHSDFLGFPAKSGDLDLRTAESNNIEAFLGSWRSKPEAAFNRRKYDDQENIRVGSRPDAWIGFVQRELETFATLDLNIATVYSANTRNVDITVMATAKEILSGEFKLHVLITEDNITTAQKSTTTTIEKYKHKHTLRTSLTPVEGVSWFQALGANLERELSFSFTLPDEEDMGWWIPENCHVVAFVTKGSEKEVLQAAETSVVAF